MTRSRGRQDTTQPQIVKEIRSRPGWEVEIFSQYREHPFDILVMHDGRSLPFEVKKDHKAKLTDKEIITHKKYSRAGVTIYVVDCFKDVLVAFVQNKIFHK